MLPNVKQRLERCTSLPSVPALAMKVLELCQKEDLNFAEIARTISTDPALATKVLRMANSPVMGLRNPAKTVSHALALLGINAVRTLALSFSLVSDLRGKDKANGYKQYWKRSITAGIAAQELASNIKLPHAEEAFLSSLLQDIGMLALAQGMPDVYPEIIVQAAGDHRKLIEGERAELGCDHADVGQWLLTRWKLPGALSQIVGASHGDFSSCTDPESRQFASVVALSGLVADIWVSGDAGSATELAQAQAEALLGLSKEALAPVLKNVAGAMLGDMAKLLEVDMGSQDEINGILDEAKETLVMLTLRAEQAVEQARESHTVLEEKHRALSEESQRDKLTKLYNRERLDAYLLGEFERAAAAPSGKGLSVLFCDVDFFKKVNDTYGHQAGDDVLVAIALQLGDRLRTKDLAARYGGEEFILVLPDTDRAGARVVAERVRQRIEAATIETRAGPLKVTVSIGCATVIADGRYESVSALVGAADLALYAAKRGGRNRVVDAEQLTSSTCAA